MTTSDTQGTLQDLIDGKPVEVTGACERCYLPIGFPFERIGQQGFCPHCGSLTVLDTRMRTLYPGRIRARLIIASRWALRTAIVAYLAFCVWGWF